MNKVNNPELLHSYMELSVANFYSCDTKNGLEYYSGTLESHELSRKLTTEKIKGGQDNATLAVIDKSTDLSLKIVDVCARQDIQALKLGGKITNVIASDNVYAFHMPKNYVVSNEKKVTLDALPKEGEDVAIYNNATGNKLTKTTDYTIDGKEITIVNTDIKAQDTVFVTGFYYKAPTNAKYFEMNEGSAPTMFTIIEVPLFKEGKKIGKKQYIFPKTQISGDMTVKGQTEKTKSTDETTLDILKDQSVDYLGRVVYLFNDVEETTEDVSYTATDEITNIEPSDMIYDSVNNKFIGVPLDIDIFYFKDGETTKTATKTDGNWSIV